MNEPNWIVTAVFGALLGFIPEIYKILKNLVLRFSKNRIVGEWHVYEVTLVNNQVIQTTGKCVIKNGILHRFSVYMSNDNLIYRGNANVEDNHLFMMLTNKNDRSIRKETCWQRYDFSYDNYDFLYGLWLSNNYDGHTSCGVSILSKGALNRDDIDNIISSKYISISDKLVSVKY